MGQQGERSVGDQNLTPWKGETAAGEEEREREARAGRVFICCTSTTTHPVPTASGFGGPPALRALPIECMLMGRGAGARSPGR